MEQAIQPVPGKLVPQGEITFEEFLQWSDEDTHAEWVGGKVRVKMPASRVHQDCNGFLYTLLKLWCDHYDAGKVFHPPFPVHLVLPDGRAVGREPDLVVVLKEHLDRLQELHVEGAPDLVVEIVSKGSRGEDRGEKFYEYEAAGVPEYWIIDPDRQHAEFYQLQENGVYSMVFSSSGGVYRSRVLNGFWLHVEWCWQQPPVWEALRAWGLV
ncbi:MAG: Uma2 family endonuclease [Armatimonadota bacterium]